MALLVIEENIFSQGFQERSFTYPAKTQRFIDTDIVQFE